MASKASLEHSEERLSCADLWWGEGVKELLRLQHHYFDHEAGPSDEWLCYFACCWSKSGVPLRSFFVPKRPKVIKVDNFASCQTSSYALSNSASFAAREHTQFFASTSLFAYWKTLAFQAHFPDERCVFLAEKRSWVRKSLFTVGDFIGHTSESFGFDLDLF